MNLVLRGLSLNDNALSQPLVGHFDERGGSIGRSDSATMTLPDPERLISRMQAKISFDDATYWLEDVSTANPVMHNGQALGPGVKVPLRPNDDLRIGGYRLAVEYEETDSSSTILRGRVPRAPRGQRAPNAAGAAMAQAPAKTGPGPFADLLADEGKAGAAAASDPFADLLTPAADNSSATTIPRVPPAPSPSLSPSPSSFPSASSSPSSFPSPSPSSSAAPAARLPDDFDPFAEFAPQPAPLPAIPDDPLGVVGAAPCGGKSIDEIFGLSFGPGALNEPKAAPGRDPIADFLAKPVGPSRTDAAARQLDPMSMFDAPGPATPAVASDAPSVTPAASNHVSELEGAFTPPSVTPPVMLQPAKAKAAPLPKERKAAAVTAVARKAVPPAAATASAAADSSSYTADEIWRGFLEGAGVDVALPRGVTPEMMRTVGVMLRSAVEGMLQLMAVRTAAKNELRAPVTVIQVRDNNPLKFSPDATAALLQLLQPPGRGFMPGPQAVQDALVDLQSHQIGTMAGMRAALAGVLERFRPEQLEGRLTGQSVLDTLLPMNRKAKLWELFLQHYRSIRDDAEEDFHQLFGKAFVAAYEEQVERLAQAKPSKQAKPIQDKAHNSPAARR